MPFTLPPIAMPPSLAKGTIPLVALAFIAFCSLTASFRFLNQGQYLVPLPSGEQRQHEAVAATLIPHRLSFNYKNNILEDKEPAGLYNNLINTISVTASYDNNETDSAT
jgi:hypothetical protein